jgi:hypothetical protein
MPVPMGDEYWAIWAQDYCQVAAVHPQRPGVAFAEMTGQTSNTVATSVARLRRKGFITPIESGPPRLTPKTLELLKHLDRPAESIVAFNVQILAKNKADALAKLWELELQLENWDPTSGPFRPREKEE